MDWPMWSADFGVGKLRLDVFTEAGLRLDAASLSQRRKDNFCLGDERHDLLRATGQVEEGLAKCWLPRCCSCERRQVVVVDLARKEAADDIVGRPATSLPGN